VCRLYAAAAGTLFLQQEPLLDVLFGWSCSGSGSLSLRGPRVWRPTVCLEELIKDMWLPYVKLAAHDAAVIHAQHSVNIFHTLRANISELLDLGCRIFDLVIRKAQLELLNAALNGVPASQTVPNRNVARETKVLGLEDFVRARVIQNGFGVDSGLVRECAIASNRVVERNGNLDSIGNEILYLTQHRKVILGFDVFRIRGIEARNECPQWSDTNTFTNT